MKKLLLALAVAGLGHAAAQPLLGGTGRLEASRYCVVFRCEKAETLPRTADISETLYLLPDEHGDSPPAEAVVMQQTGRMVSVSYRVGAQDFPFVSRYIEEQVSGLLETLVGVRPPAAFLRSTQFPDISREAPQRREIRAGGRTFRILTYSVAGRGFWWHYVTVF